MKHKILILARDAASYQPLIESANLPELDEIMVEPASDCDIVIGEPSMLSTVLPKLPDLKWAQSIWAGVEPLLDPTLNRNYILTNARGVFGELMSEYVIGYLLAHERKILHLHDLQRSRIWDKSNLGSIRGKTIGLLGVGSIGAQVARTAKFFNMTVHGYTRENEMSKDVDQYFHGSQLRVFAKDLDYLVCILPNTKDTRKIVNSDLLKALPKHALFINAGRGAAVDETALIEALIDHHLAGAVLDVFEKEPLPEDHPFWSTPNLTITFHTAAPSIPRDIADLFIENYYLYIQDKPLKYRVNFERGY